MKRAYLADLIHAVEAMEATSINFWLEQVVNFRAAGANSGALRGFFEGSFFVHPVTGRAMGSASATMAANLEAFGIDNTFQYELTKALAPCLAATVMLAEGPASAHRIDRARGAVCPILRSNLAHEPDAVLKRAILRSFAEPRPSSVAMEGV